jgi:predicted DNA-binding transcriptional regulator AlpA
VNTPKNLIQFGKWLDGHIEQLELLCQYGEPDFFNEFEVAQVVQDARRHAARLGLCASSEQVPTTMSAGAGLAIIGDMRAQVDQRTEQQSGLLSDKQVGKMLGISSRTVWRRSAAHEIPAPIKVGGLTMWRRDEIQAMIDEAEPVRR